MPFWANLNQLWNRPRHNRGNYVYSNSGEETETEWVETRRVTERLHIEDVFFYENKVKITNLSVLFSHNVDE